MIISSNQHDHSLFKEELNSKMDRFVSTEAVVDLSYPGIQIDASLPENIHVSSIRKLKRILILCEHASNSESIALDAPIEQAIVIIIIFLVQTIRLNIPLKHGADDF